MMGTRGAHLRDILGPAKTYSLLLLGPRTAPTFYLNNSRAIGSLLSKTRVLRHITPESSPELSAKSLSHSFFCGAFSALKTD